MNFDWNYSGVEGTLDFYQPHHGETLVDADFDNLQRDSRYGLVIHRLAPTGDSCDIKRLGRTLENGHLGTMITDRKGNGAIHNFRDVDIDDIIGMSVVLQGRYEDFAYRSPLANNNILAQIGTEQMMGTCNCVAGPILTPNPADGTPTPLMLECPGLDMGVCPEDWCIANGFSCPTCAGLPQHCFSDAAEMMPVT